jgi:hypothetical protein
MAVCVWLLLFWAGPAVAVPIIPLELVSSASTTSWGQVITVDVATETTNDQGDTAAASSVSVSRPAWPATGFANARGSSSGGILHGLASAAVGVSFLDPGEIAAAGASAKQDVGWQDYVLFFSPHLPDFTFVPVEFAFYVEGVRTADFVDDHDMTNTAMTAQLVVDHYGGIVTDKFVPFQIFTIELPTGVPLQLTSTLNLEANAYRWGYPNGGTAGIIDVLNTSAFGFRALDPRVSYVSASGATYGAIFDDGNGTSIPEPSSAALAGAAIAVTLGFRRRWLW